MKTKIKLVQNYGIVSDKKIILEKEEKFELEFEHAYKNCDLLCECENESEKYILKAQNGIVKFGYLIDGNLKIKAILMRDNEIIKSFNIEPLIIKKHLEDYEIIPQLAEFEENMTKVCEDMQKCVLKMQKEFAQLKQLVYADLGIEDLGGNEND